MTVSARAVRATGDVLPVSQLYTAEEVSAMTKGAVSAYWLEKHARLEDIPARKIGRAWRWTQPDIDALWDSFLRVPRQRSRR